MRADMGRRRALVEQPKRLLHQGQRPRHGIVQGRSCWHFVVPRKGCRAPKALNSVLWAIPSQSLSRVHAREECVSSDLEALPPVVSREAANRERAPLPPPGRQDACRPRWFDGIGEPSAPFKKNGPGRPIPGPPDSILEPVGKPLIVAGSLMPAYLSHHFGPFPISLAPAPTG